MTGALGQSGPVGPIREPDDAETAHPHRMRRFGHTTSHVMFCDLTSTDGHNRVR